MTDTARAVVGRGASGAASARVVWWWHVPLTVRTLAGGSAAIVFAVIAQLPLSADRPALFLANVGVAAGCVAGGIVLADEPHQRGSAWLIATAGLLWPVAWVNVWHSGPLPLVAMLTGPLPQTLAIWGLLLYPRAFAERRSTLAMAAVLTLAQLVTAATVVTSRPEWNGERPGTVWITFVADRVAWATWTNVYNLLVVVLAAGLVGVYLVRVARLPAFERRVTVPLALAVVLAGLGTFLSGVVELVQPPAGVLTGFYFAEDLLQLPVPAVLLVSAIVRRSAPQRLSRAAATLRSGATPLAVQAAIGRALGDPQFRVYYRTAPDAGWTDSSGAPVLLPTTSARQASHEVLDEQGSVVAMLVGSAHLDRYGRLLQTAARSFWLLLSNGRLLVALQAEVLATARIGGAARHTRRAGAQAHPRAGARRAVRARQAGAADHRRPRGRVRAAAP